MNYLEILIKSINQINNFYNRKKKKRRKLKKKTFCRKQQKMKRKKKRKSKEEIKSFPDNKKPANLMTFSMKMIFKKFPQNHQTQQFHHLLPINLMRKSVNVQLKKYLMSQKKLQPSKIIFKMIHQLLSQSFLKKKKSPCLKFVKPKMSRWDSQRKSLHICQLASPS